jgi:hypothetical protein
MHGATAFGIFQRKMLQCWVRKGDERCRYLDTTTTVLSEALFRR